MAPLTFAGGWFLPSANIGLTIPQTPSTPDSEPFKQAYNKLHIFLSIPLINDQR